jgi:hypothetical protein
MRISHMNEKIQGDLKVTRTETTVSSRLTHPLQSYAVFTCPRDDRYSFFIHVRYPFHHLIQSVSPSTR